MIKYVDRHNTNCVKWDCAEEIFNEKDLLPLWVADMDFRAPDCVTDALCNYSSRGVFGYDPVPDSFFDAFIKWEKEVHSLDVKKEEIFFSPGVVTGLHWSVLTYTNEKDSVMIQPPVYPPFFKVIEENNRNLVINELKYNNGSYEIDFDDFEKKIKSENVKLFILCSPHNPCGRVWKMDELSKIVKICNKYNVLIAADEIHQDIISEGFRQIPLQKISFAENVISLTAPSKTFNLAGLKLSVIIIKNKELRTKWEKFQETTKIKTLTPFAYIAATEAYKGGHDWLVEVEKQIEENYNLLKENLETSLPNLIFTPLEGTYLAWINFKHYIKPEEMENFFTHTCHIAPNYGSWFRGNNSDTFIRINLATKPENIEKACEKIKSNINI